MISSQLGTDARFERRLGCGMGPVASSTSDGCDGRRRAPGLGFTTTVSSVSGCFSGCFVADAAGFSGAPVSSDAGCGSSSTDAGCG